VDADAMAPRAPDFIDVVMGKSGALLSVFLLPTTMKTFSTGFQKNPRTRVGDGRTTGTFYNGDTQR
jgi:hypothetical protein